MALKWIGGKAGSMILGVPARDLSEKEISDIEAQFGWTNLRQRLIESGSYAEAEERGRTSRRKTTEEGE